MFELRDVILCACVLTDYTQKTSASTVGKIHKNL